MFDRTRAAVAGLLALLFVLSLLAFAHTQAVYEAPDDAYGAPISTDAFFKGYDAILEELTTPPVQPLPSAPEETVIFSLDKQGSAFFSEDCHLAMSEAKSKRIYYTLDGSDPRTSDSIRRYIEPLLLEAEDAPVMYRIRAAAFYTEKNDRSEVTERTYIVGKNVFEQLNVPVWSITIDEKQLFDPEIGIFHTNNQHKHGVEWEREMQVVLYDEHGRPVFDMPAGIRIYGGYSRSHVLKSMRIIARPRYSEVQDDFVSMNLFGALRYDPQGLIIDRYEDIVIRNTGNDFGDLHLRDELIHVLMAQQGFVFTEPVRPCLVYINGELYGFFWMHEPYKESYFETRFDAYDYQGEFVVLDGPERAKSPDGEEHVGYDPLEDYKQMLALGEKDLTDDENYAALCRVLDVESYLALNATMALVDNGDWPQNNNRVFKYFAAEGEDFSDVYGMDGKWYFVPHDTDWGLRGNSIEDTLRWYYDKTAIQYSPLFCHLMEREDCRNYYVSAMLDMINGAFSTENSLQVLEEIVEEMRAPLELYLAQSPYVPENYDMAKFERRLNSLQTYLLVRPEAMRHNLDGFYDLGAPYDLTVRVPSGAGVTVNTLERKGNFEGVYHENYPTRLSPIVPLGDRFEAWVVNGQRVEGEHLTIDPSVAIEGKITVELILTSSHTLHVSEIGYRDGEDYIVLTNFGTEPVSTLGYAISDDETMPARFRLPVMTVEPGDSVIIYGKNYDPEKALRQLQLDFDFSAGETMMLTYTDHKTMEMTAVDRAVLPKLHEGFVYVRDPFDHRFYEILKCY